MRLKRRIDALEDLTALLRYDQEIDAVIAGFLLPPDQTSDLKPVNASRYSRYWDPQREGHRTHGSTTFAPAYQQNRPLPQGEIVPVCPHKWVKTSRGSSDILRPSSDVFIKRIIYN